MARGRVEALGRDRGQPPLATTGTGWGMLSEPLFLFAIIFGLNLLLLHHRLIAR